MNMIAAIVQTKYGPMPIATEGLSFLAIGIKRIRWSWDHIIIIMVITILARWYLYWKDLQFSNIKVHQARKSHMHNTPNWLANTNNLIKITNGSSSAS